MNSNDNRKPIQHNTDQTNTNQLSSLLAAQQQSIEELFQVMDKETQAIATKKAKDIAKVAVEKMSLIQSLQQRDQQIAVSLQQHILTPEQQEQLQSLKQQFLKCQQKNHINGVALQRTAVSMHKLHNLIQKAMGGENVTYNNEGQIKGKGQLGSDLKA